MTTALSTHTDPVLCHQDYSSTGVITHPSLWQWQHSPLKQIARLKLIDFISAASPGDGQRLRPRKRLKTEADAEAAAAADAAEKRRNARRPLVLLLQGAEAADPHTLGALVSVLSEVGALLTWQSFGCASTRT